MPIKLKIINMSIAISNNSILSVYNEYTEKIVFIDTLKFKLIEDKTINPIFTERSNLKFSTDNNSIYFWGGWGKTDGIEKYDITNGQLLWSHYVNQPSSIIAISNNNQLVAVAGIKEISLINNDSGELIKRISWKQNSKNWITELIGFTKDDSSLIVKDKNNIGVINIKNGKEKNTPINHGSGYDSWINNNQQIFQFGSKVGKNNIGVKFSSINIIHGHEYLGISSISNSNKYIALVFESGYNASSQVLLLDIDTKTIVGNFKDSDSSLEIVSSAIDETNKRLYIEYTNDSILVFEYQNPFNETNEFVFKYKLEKHDSIFLSHSSKDKEKVRKINEYLTNRVITNWFDEAEIKPGDSLIQKISEGIQNMDYLGIILSSNSVESKWVKEELEIALNMQILSEKVKVIPILLEDCKIPLFLKGKLYIDCRDENFDDGLRSLVARLKKKKPKNNIHTFLI